MRRLLLLLCALLLIVASGCAARPVVQPEPGFSISFIDVGQGDAILIQDGGAACLIDAGKNYDGELVLDYIRSRGVTRLRLAVGTHPDADHVGGLDTVLLGLPVEQLLVPVRSAETGTYRDVLDAAARKRVDIVTAESGQTFQIGDISLTVLAPLREYKDGNNGSVVVRAAYGPNVFLLTGDIERQAELDLVDAGVDLTCDVLKAAHHGSDTSSSYAFLREANPKMVVISCGSGNSYGHPHDAAMSRFRDVGATTYRTDELGTVVMRADGGTITANVAGQTSDRTHTDAPGGISPGGNYYVGNINSKKFHLPTCSSLPAERNRVFFAHRDEAAEAGFAPCAICKP
jgi:beta-lactamase superfamily II metal-dependent hydrolase